MGFNTYILRVTKFDMTAAEAMALTERDKNYLFGEFVEQATSIDAAIGNLSARLGYGIATVVVEGGSGEDVSEEFEIGVA